MRYDPFARGPFPVGVRTFTLRDHPRNDRTLPVEVWYPAMDAHAGADLDTAPGYVRDAAGPSTRHPGGGPRCRAAIRAGIRWSLFSHGFGGHRRQSTFLCTHVASHGYVVAACDHTGNTVLDVMRAALAARAGEPMPDFGDSLRSFAVARPADVRALLDQLLDGLAGELGGLIDRERIGMSGHSFGGWTTLSSRPRTAASVRRFPSHPRAARHRSPSRRCTTPSTSAGDARSRRSSWSRSATPCSRSPGCTSSSTEPRRDRRSWWC